MTAGVSPYRSRTLRIQRSTCETARSKESQEPGRSHYAACQRSRLSRRTTHPYAHPEPLAHERLCHDGMLNSKRLRAPWDSGGVPSKVRAISTSGDGRPMRQVPLDLGSQADFRVILAILCVHTHMDGPRLWMNSCQYTITCLRIIQDTGEKAKEQVSDGLCKGIPPCCQHVWIELA